MKLLTTLLLSTTALLQAEVKVTVGDIDDRRTTGRFQAGLEINLRASGPELAAGKGVRVVLASATDDTGQNLQPPKDKTNFFAANDSEFKPLAADFSGFNSGEKKKDEGILKLALSNPARAAKTVKISGTIEILNPAADPQSIITVKLATEAGKPLVNEALKATGAQLTFEPSKGDSAGYKIADPNNKIASVEFCTADGSPLKTNSWSASGGFGGSKSKSVTFEKKAPADLIAKVYLLTDKAVTRVPLKLDAIALP